MLKARSTIVQKSKDNAVQMNNNIFKKKLKGFRKKIDTVDAEIIRLLAARKKLVKKVGELKSHYHVQIKDPKREAQLMRFYARMSKRYQLHPDFVRHVFKTIIVQSRRLQK